MFRHIHGARGIAFIELLLLTFCFVKKLQIIEYFLNFNQYFVQLDSKNTKRDYIYCCQVEENID